MEDTEPVEEVGKYQDVEFGTPEDGALVDAKTALRAKLIEMSIILDDCNVPLRYLDLEFMREEIDDAFETLNQKVY